MFFHEKLSFLIDTCQISSKALSSKLSVDPSLISLLKTGKRRKPRNLEYLYAMADLFSRSIHSDFQRNTLADVIGDPDINMMFDSSDLCAVIFSWLNAPESASGAGSTDSSLTVASVSPAPNIIRPEIPYNYCYTAAEKRTALKLLLDLMLKSDRLSTLYLSLNESMTWLTEDQQFAESVQNNLSSLLARGVRIVHIYSSFAENKQSLKYLDTFFPVFGSGRISVYFCPYLRYSISHHTLVIAPEIGAIASHSTERQHDAASLFTTDPRLTGSLLNEFQNYLSYCSPMFNYYSSTTPLVQGLHETLFYTGNCTLLSPGLSNETLPLQLIVECENRAIGPGQREYIARYLQDTPQFIKRLEHCTVMDLARLPSADDVLSGKVPVVLSQGFTDPPVMYTADSFVLHLKNLIWLLEHYANYHLIPYSSSVVPEFSVIAQEHMHVMFTRTAPPYISCKITHPEVVENIQSFLLYRIKQLRYSKKDKKLVIEKLNQLITELSH